MMNPYGHGTPNKLLEYVILYEDIYSYWHNALCNEVRK